MHVMECFIYTGVKRTFSINIQNMKIDWKTYLKQTIKISTYIISYFKTQQNHKTDMKNEYIFPNA